MPSSASKARGKRRARAPVSSPLRPRVCRRCADSPPLSECIHSVAGREFLRLRAEMRSVTLESQESTKTPGRRCRVCPGRPLLKQCSHTKAGKKYLLQAHIEVQISNTLLQTAQRHDEDPEESQQEEDTNPFPGPHLVPATPTRSNRPFAPAPPLFSMNSPPVSPAPHANSTEQDVSALQTPASRRGQVIDDSMIDPNLLSQNVETHTPASNLGSEPSTRNFRQWTPGRKREYKRATKGNAKHGVVNGCMRGASEHEVVRRHARPAPIEEASKASRRFLDNFDRIVERCDDLAAKTGCWLFIGVQHPGAVGSSLHYSSPRLVRDGRQVLEDIVNDFDDLMSDLVAARRVEALQLRNQLRQTVKEKETLEDRLKTMEAHMGNLTQTLDIYARRLGLPGVDSE